jgi:membrane protease subunit HflC
MKAQLALIPIILLLWAVYVCSYVVEETDQVIITQFGKPVGEPITEAGLYFKLPFIQEINRIEKRFLPWDGPEREMTTMDKKYIVLDTFARWRIIDPMQYFLKLTDETRALNRLDSILGSEARKAVANHRLSEIVRTDKYREPEIPESLLKDGDAEIAETFDMELEDKELLEAIEIGREKVEMQIFENAKVKVLDFGIELLDIRIKRVNYNESVRPELYLRMISDRNKVADLFRSKGKGEAARIRGIKEKELQQIASKSYKIVQQNLGQADANASAIYAEAYNSSSDAAEFYSFLKTLETYEEILQSDISFIMSTNSSLLKLLKSSSLGTSKFKRSETAE